MTPEQFAGLERGDIVRHPADGRAWLVTANHGGRVTLVDTVEASNPAEWELVYKAAHVAPDRCGEVLSGLGGRLLECELPTGHPLPHEQGDTRWRPLSGGGL